MDDFLFYVFLALVGGLVWLHLNQRNTNKINVLKPHFHYVELIELALILCAGSMCAYFTYQVFSSVSETLATLAAVLVVAFNLGESILITNMVNSARHKNTLLVGLNVIGILCIAGYSLTAGSSILDTIIGKGDDLQRAYQYQVQASQQRIAGAKAEILEAQTKARESDRYDYLNSSVVAKAQKDAALLSATEFEKMAQLTKNKAPELKIAFGFDKQALAFLMAFSLELSIILVGIFKNLYIKSTPLLSAIRFKNKELDYQVNPNHLNNLSLEHSPSPTILGLPSTMHLTYAGTSQAVQSVAIATPSSYLAQPVSPNLERKVTQGLERDLDRTDTQGRGDIALAPSTVQERAFNEWLEALKHSDLEPTAPPTKQFISERKLAKGIALIGAMANDWLERAFNLGVLELRQPQKNGLSKYVLASVQETPLLSLEKGKGI
jgi:hypothetical protein